MDYSALPNKATENLRDFILSPLFTELSGIPFIFVEQEQPKGIKVCLSGRFSRPKAVLKEELENKGYQVVDNLTNDVEILYVADKNNTTTKITKAKKLNINIEEL